MHDAPTLRLDHREEGDVTVITAVGDIDVLTAPRLRELLLELIERGRRRFVVNVADVAFLDSTALGVLIGAWRRVRCQGGVLALAGAPEAIRQVFHVTCLTHNFGLYESTAEAIEACRRVGQTGGVPL